MARILAATAAVMAGLLMATTAAPAQPISINGAWNGAGTLTLPSGASERVRCRAVFSQRGDSAYMTATCANASTRVNQTAELTRVSANRFSGDFLNRDYGISGSIRLTVNGNSMSASLAGGGGTAAISLSR
jgi:hypothetical protein